MRAIYYIVISGSEVPVVQSTEEGLVVLNPLILLVPGHISVEKEGEDNLFINDVWDIQKALSKQKMLRSTLREDTETNEFDEPHIK
jgi:hypothetical protein